MDFLLNKNAETIETVINEKLNVIVINNASSEDFSSISRKLYEEGYELKEENNKSFHRFNGYLKGKNGVFVNYYVNASEITVSYEKECNYFDYTDNKGGQAVTAQITQLHLEDFGMSYVIRISDGRFIVIDGGWDLTPDAERLYDVLKAGSIHEKPVIAAWIMTHMHTDHYRCFNRFTELHKDDVVIEKFMFNFSQANKNGYDEEKSFYKADIKEEYALENTSDKLHIERMYENVKLYDAEVYTPHAGQVYKIGDSVWECLACVDDIYHFSMDDNAASLVFRMELAGQIVLWTGDASFSDSGLLAKYGKYLKADILQVPHHGFVSGDAKEQQRCYDLIDAEVCMLSLSSYNAYTAFCTYLEATEYLMKNTSISELITGDETVTLTLPYHAPSYAREEFKTRFYEGRKAAGSKVWIYSGLNSSEPEDFVFEILNPTHREHEIMIDFFFEDATQRLTGTSIFLPRYSVKSYNLRDPESVTLNKYHFNWESVNKREIPENTVFAVRFMSETGFVVTHKKHQASYNE